MHRAPQAMLSHIPPDVTVNTPRDANTLSNYHNFQLIHTIADFGIDFDKKLLAGRVNLTFKSITNAETSEIVLDTSFLNVKDVNIAGKKAEWNVAARIEPYGSPLTIKLDRGVKKDEKFEVEIDVSTTDKCTALQWLEPAQTSNRKHPYMFSQCQAIHARSIYPCQDTPDSKGTFEFLLRSKLPVLASGRPAGVEKVSDSEHIYKFTQPVPMPAYLFAIASGDIVSAPIGPRSEVWTGPDELADSKWELEQDTEKFIKIAEDLVFPYAWGTYNVLVLPPSFPYGGMENPQYTFATPTIISGDRQNVDVIAHELSHSWSGNLVSAASWSHFWLNEGWTTYLERRIQAAVHGSDAYRDFSAIIGWKALEDSVERYGVEHEFTQLITDLNGKDPDDAFSSIPYEKGFIFLYHLEKLVGKEKWDKFIPHYFTTFRNRSLDSYEFKATLLSFFASDASAAKALESLDWDTWFYAPGYPPKPSFDTSLVDACYALADKWLSLLSPSPSFTPSPSDIASFSGNQTVVFLEHLQKLQATTTPSLPASLTHNLGETYNLTATKNVEIISRYLSLGLRAGDASLKDATAELLGRVGRMKFVRPLYKDLVGLDREFAVRVFRTNAEFYHPICRGLVEKDLFGGGKEAAGA